METKNVTSVEISESSPKTESQQKLAALMRLLTTGLAALFIFALAVQFLRGKLWVVGSTGVWLLFVAMVATATLTVLLEQPRTAPKLLALPAKITPFGLGLFLLTLFGFWIRVWGNKNGLPYVVGADESLYIDNTTNMLKTGSLEIVTYYYPTFYIYLQAIVAAVQFLWGNITGLYTSLNDFPNRTYGITTAPQAYIWARTFTALIGTASIPLVYFLVRRIWGDRRAALLAAGFLTCSALATEHSHYISVDIPVATLMLAALWPAWNIIEKGRTRDYIFCGVLVGLAVGTKWNGLFAVVLPLTAHLFRVQNEVPPYKPAFGYVLQRYISPKILWSLFTVGATLLATTPLLLAQVRQFSDGLATSLLKYRNSQSDYTTDFPWMANLQTIWEDSLIFFLLGLGGVLLFAFRRKQAEWLTLVFPLAYLLSINGYRLIYRRNVLPLTYYFTIFAALCAVWLLDLALSRLPSIKLSTPVRWAAGLVLPILFLVGVMFAPLDSIFYGNRFNDQPFSYARTEDWIKQNVGPGPVKVVEMRPQQWGAYPNLIAYFDEGGANDYSLDYYRERGIQYLAINRDRVAGEQNKGTYPELLKPELIAQEIKTKEIGMPGPPYLLVRTGVTPETLKLQHLQNVTFGGKIKLLGINSGKIESVNGLYLPPKNEAKAQENWPNYKAGDIIGLSVYWQVLDKLPQDYTVYVHLRPVDAPDKNVATRDTFPLLGQYPTSRWKPGEILTDNPNLALPGNVAPGDYVLVMGLYLNDGNFTPLTLPDGAGGLTIGKIKIIK